MIQVLASLENRAAGPSYSVTRLAQSLADRGIVSEIMTTGASSEKTVAGVRYRTFPVDDRVLPGLRSLCFSKALDRALGSAVLSGSVIHSHGQWLMPNLYPAWATLRRRGVHIVSPRGMLGPAALGFSRRRKQVVWLLAQKRALMLAACIHATSSQECEELRSLGIRTPVAIIPNGIDMPADVDIAVARDQRPPNQRTLLHLGRIHPKKGIDRLVDAWARVESRFPDWSLLIVGPSECGHREELESRVRGHGLSRVTFEDAKFGSAKDAAYAGANLFVLPTLNENFGMVVAEALANGTPVICTRGAPWAGLERVGAGWWIEHGVEALAQALGVAMAMPVAQLDVMGDRGRRWMATEFCWENVARDLEQVYRWCAEGGARPKTVDISI